MRERAKQPTSLEEHFGLLEEIKQLKKKIRALQKKLQTSANDMRKITGDYKAWEASRSKVVYKVAKGDAVDQKLAEFFASHYCSAPLKCLGGGYYMFGTKKIYAMVISGKLVIRVGGGYMGIEEFIKVHAEKEFDRMRSIVEADNARLAAANAQKAGRDRVSSSSDVELKKKDVKTVVKSAGSGDSAAQTGDFTGLG